MKNLEIFCDRCSKEITAENNYEITILYNPMIEDIEEDDDDYDDMDDVDFESDVKIIDLCESCYDKFCALNYDIMSNEKEGD